MYYFYLLLKLAYCILHYSSHGYCIDRCCAIA